MFGWKHSALSEETSIEDSLLYLCEDLKVPLWTSAKHWLVSNLSPFQRNTSYSRRQAERTNHSSACAEGIGGLTDLYIQRPPKAYVPQSTS